ncbi:hypothetical protein [Humidisolicoccus flavus]|uniref:hypothetical protein n=1 Tax=Humidisolicoccus flavus TaxID=3111414 RepID=UPI003248C600
MFAVDAPDVYGPYQYGPWWMLAFGILVALILIYFAVWWFTQPKGILTPPPPPPRQVHVPTLKQKYLDMIGEVAAESERGELTPRELSQKLSLVLRFFAHESTGIVAEVMTLEDLSEANLPSVHGAVAEYYPSSFRRAAKTDPESAVQLARKVVATWM